ncbi:hypothetical protein Tco_0174552 [Tanacetum coccineum]
MTSDSSRKLKTRDAEVTAEAPYHGVPQEEESCKLFSKCFTRGSCCSSSFSGDIPAAQVEVPSQKATIEDVDAPSNLASTAQHTASSLQEGVIAYGVRLDQCLLQARQLLQVLHKIRKLRELVLFFREILRVLMDSSEVYDGSDVEEPAHLEYSKLEAIFVSGVSCLLETLSQELMATCKASSNPLLFFDSPLPGVNTPWDVMRIVCNPDLMDIMLLQWFFDAASSMLLAHGILKIQQCCCWFKVSSSASIGFVFLLLLSLNPQAHKCRSI